MWKWFENDGVLIPRTFAETPLGLDFIQPIPYLLVKRKGVREWFVYRRTENQQETRLHNTFSLGVGGHVSVADCEVKDDVETISSRFGSIVRAMQREQAEEVRLYNPELAEGEVVEIEPTLVGAIYDPDFDVSRHHCAIVYEVEVEAVEILETDQMEGGFMSVHDIRTSRKLENWSDLILNKYIVQ